MFRNYIILKIIGYKILRKLITNILKCIKSMSKESIKKCCIVSCLCLLMLPGGIHICKGIENYRDNEDLPANYEEKVEAVKGYIAYAIKNQNYKYKDLQVSPEAFVIESIKNDFDLPLMLAQAHQESCFGMSARARKTNSVFAIGSHDDGTNKRFYDTQDESIAEYINLLKNHYLVNGKTELDLLKTNGFVDCKNNRYASDENYEANIRRLRNKIIKMYPVLAD